MEKRKVSIGIVTFNKIRFLPDCFKSIFQQTYPDIEVTAVDNNSRDGSPDFIRKNYPRIKLIRNSENLGFSYAQNQAIQNSDGEFYLSLNQDAILTPTCVEELVKAMQVDSSVGIAAGKIYHLDNDFIIKESLNTLDSTGLYLTRNVRHFDRGSGEIDRGQ